jgi:two-component system OmpR family sensor kinase
VAQASIAYRTALADADQIFDYHMQQMALSLRSRVPLANSEEAGNVDTPLAGNDDLVVQVWSPDGVQVFRSASHARLPQRAVLGFSNVRANGTTYRIFSIQTSAQTVQVAQDLAVRKSMASNLALRTLGPIAVMMPILMLVVWWVVSGSLEPVARVRKQLASRQADDLSPVSDAGLPDEVRPLVQELNLLFGRVRTAFDTQQNFVADAAHELRTPLAALKLQVQSLERSDSAPTASRRASWPCRACRPASSARPAWSSSCWCWRARKPARRRASRSSWPSLARRAVADLIGVAQAKQIDLGLQRADAGEVEGQPEALMILLRNLVDNAIKYTPGGGTVDVSVAAEQGALAAASRSRTAAPASRRGTRARVRPLLPRARQRRRRQRPGPGHHQAIAERHGATLALGPHPSGSAACSSRQQRPSSFATRPSGS